MAICREIGQRLTATVPRILATILNGTIVAGMVVLLHRCRTARLIPCRALAHFARDGYLFPVYDRFIEGLCDMRATLDSLLPRLPYRLFAGAELGARTCKSRRVQTS